MIGICGWIGAKPVEQVAVLSAMCQPLGATQPTQQWHDPVNGLAVIGEHACLVQTSGLQVALLGHPRWEGLADQTLPRAALAFSDAYRTEGAGALRRLHGDFALALIDAPRRRGLLAVDRFSVHNLVYRADADGLRFGSTLDALAAHPRGERRLDPQALYDYLFFHVVPGPQTIFEGHLRLPAGHYLEYDADGRSQLAPYWQLRFDEQRHAQLGELKREFVEHLQRAVVRTAGEPACGTFLSGGTDSSTVTGMLGRARGGPIDAFSIGFDADGYDEMDYARIASGHFGARHHTYYVTPDDVVAAVPRIAACFDQPFGNASAVPAYYCARLARERGMRRLLAGDGGDELFGGNQRYAKQQIFGLYRHLPAIVRRGLIEPLLPAKGLASRLPLLRKASSYVAQATAPMPDRYEARNLLEHLGAQHVLAPAMLDGVDLGHPHTLLREAHAPYADCSLINQMLGIDVRFVLADGDLPKVTGACALAGIDVAFPMLDDDLVAFSERLAPSLKLRGTRLRWFFKEALRDFLPKQIITKSKQGFGLPVGTWLRTHPPLRALARDGMDRVRQRGLLQPGFIDDLDRRLLDEHPAYYGTLIWILMMLGLWLESRRM